MTVKVDLSFTLNGRPKKVSVPADMGALTLLRDVLGLFGTKLACGEGECGACTIIADGISVNSCLMYAADCEGRNIQTIEGLRSEAGLDPLQTAFVEHGAVQCGYCIPGMIMQAKYLTGTRADMSRDDLRRGLEGNVCRCTGYKKVLDAVAEVAGVSK